MLADLAMYIVLCAVMNFSVQRRLYPLLKCRDEKDSAFLKLSYMSALPEGQQAEAVADSQFTLMCTSPLLPPGVRTLREYEGEWRRGGKKKLLKTAHLFSH